MPNPDFSLDVTDQAVRVRLDVSRRSPGTRFYGLGFFLAVVVLGICALLFEPGKHGGPGMWHDLSSSPIDSGGFIVPLVLLFGFCIGMFLISRRYLIAAYPSDETFYCDRATLTISRVEWLDILNSHWNTRSYALADIEGIRYGVVGRARGASIYGLRFSAKGSEKRVLPGLSSQDAGTILKALKAFGADVR